MTAPLRFLLARARLYEGIDQMTSGQAPRAAGRRASWPRTLATRQQDFLSTPFGENE